MHIEFHGAAREVTGSCFLVRAAGRSVLVDCGLFQGGPADEARNARPFPFDPKKIDAVVLSHAHIDHSGRLPLLLKSGFRGPVHTHAATRDLCAIMLKDAAYLEEKGAEWDNRKRRRKGLAPVAPLYTRRDAALVVRRFRPLDYGAAEDILPGFRLRLLDAGHILGSAIVELEVSEDGRRRRLVFSGDLGHAGGPLLRDPATVPEADLVILESTYGDRLHRSWDATWAEMGDILERARSDKGNILIPAFAVGRTQELLYAFHRHFDDWGLNRWRVFLDSPMAIEATAVHARHAVLYKAPTRADGPGLFELPNLHLSRTARQSMAINRIQSGCIVIAGSGMCTGGRIKHHLKQNVWRPHCHVLIVGFQARGTPGRALVDGARFIRLWGEAIRVQAKVHTIGGLSAHADADGLAAWYGRFREAPRVVLVHGEPAAMDPLAERLQGTFGARPITPEAGARLDL